jgi:hypothetical protein
VFLTMNAQARMKNFQIAKRLVRRHWSIIIVAALGLTPRAEAQRLDPVGQPLLPAAESSFSEISGEPSGAAAEPKLRNWASATVSGAKDTAARIWNWRPRMPRIFGDSSRPLEQTQRGPEGPILLQDSTFYLQSGRPQGLGGRGESLLAAPAQVLQVPVTTSPEPAKIELPENAITLASAKPLPENVLGQVDLIYPAQIRELIAGWCGSAAKDVEVALAPDGILELQMRAASQQDAQMLSDQIIPLPELKRYRISLTITSTSSPMN